MSDRRSAKPLAFFFLMLPYGISQGYLTLTLPFVLTMAGVSVAATAAVVAIGLSANIWRFLWSPIADLTLSLRRWYVIGLILAVASLVLLGMLPPRPGALLTSLAFASQLAATLTLNPLGGMMAHTVADDRRGRASGWYQAGNFFSGWVIGGGAGVWLAEHYSGRVAALSLAGAMSIAVAALRLVPDVRPTPNERLSSRLRGIAHDIIAMLRSPSALLVAAAVMSPIGVGAASNLWSSVAGDWHASPDQVALFAGILSGVFSAVGCLVAGWLCDRFGRWWTFFGGGAMVAVVALAFAAAPRRPEIYSFGVLAYAFGMGAATAAYSALVLYACGRGAASTKYAILSSLGNVPIVYMTAFDGWAHDRWGVGGMLNAEALLAVLCIAIGLVAVRRIDRIVASAG